ncbi:MAG TPA: hypothetical protein VKX17_06295 [Planctomycetota bacterium]|nr:hypothetical protein [Planctomycetota bacterium]
MTEVDELTTRIRNLPDKELARFRDWFIEFEHQQWDRQIAADFKAGKFKKLIDSAREEFARGEAREL